MRIIFNFDNFLHILIIHFTKMNETIIGSFAGTQDDLFRTSTDSSVLKTWRIPSFGTYSTNFSLSNGNVQRFIHLKNLSFDLIINEEFYHDAYLMFAHNFKAPVILIG